MKHLRLLPLVAACAAAGFAHAAPSQEELERVRLYGNVSIAQDSVNSWGVWEQFEPPAAGPATPSIALPSTVELYRPLASVAAPAAEAAPLCASGALCGFGVSVAFAKGKFLGALSTESSESTGPRTKAFIVSPEVLAAAAQERPIGELLLPGALSTASNWQPSRMLFSPRGLDGGPTLLPEVSELTLEGVEGSYAYYESTDGTVGHLSSNGYGVNQELAEGSEADVAFMHGVLGYVGGESSSTTAGGQLHGIWGVTTATAGLEALKRDNVVINYEGGSYGGSTVALTVDFGQARVLGGSFNGGTDGGVGQYIASDGKRYITGQVGINVLGGTVQGSNFVITQMSANDGTVNGRIQGAFYGAQAQVAAGAVDVVESRTDGAYTNASYQDVFVTTDVTKRVIRNLD